MKNSTSMIGKFGEYRFASELIKRKILPCWPSFDAPGFDMIADNGIDLFRIQVKTSTIKPKRNNRGNGTYLNRKRKHSEYIQFGAEFWLRGKKTLYTKVSIDYLALYASTMNIWYIIPINKLTARTIRVYPSDSHCPWIKYKEAWHLLDKSLKK